MDKNNSSSLVVIPKDDNKLKLDENTIIDTSQVIKKRCKEKSYNVACDTNDTDSTDEENSDFLYEDDEMPELDDAESLNEFLAPGQETNDDYDTKKLRIQSRENDFCRICHGCDIDEEFLTPCRCRGTLSKVHRTCLERWLAEADSNVCELCGYGYNTLRYPKYHLLPSLWIWLWSIDTRRDRRDLIFDIVAVCCFTPIAIMGTYLGLFTAESVYSGELFQETPGSLSNLPSRLACLSILILMTTVNLGYISWILIRSQFHFYQWYSWYRRNSKVTLLMPVQIEREQQTND